MGFKGISVVDVYTHGKKFIAFYLNRSWAGGGAADECKLDACN